MTEYEMKFLKSAREIMINRMSERLRNPLSMNEIRVKELALAKTK